MSRHTPGPWKVANNGISGKKTATFRIWRNDPLQADGENKGYACIAPHVHGEANAAFIVRACNAHDDLLAALERIANHPRE